MAVSKTVHNKFPFPYCLKTFLFKTTHNYVSCGCSVTVAHRILWQKTQH